MILILFLALVGFFISCYIFSHKKRGKILICPLKADCESVIRSEYSKFLNIELEKFGIIYYGFVLISYFVIYIFNFQNLIFNFFLFVISFLAFAFSVYLTLIQILKLRNFCSWCLLSFFISTLIFFNSYFLNKESITVASQALRAVIVFVHALSAGIGVGAALTVDYLFFKFLKDRKIDEREKRIFSQLSDFMWVVLGLIIASGLFIYFSDIVKYYASVKFKFKMIIVAILSLNGFLMNFFVLPKFEKLDWVFLSSYKEKMAIILGVISAVSWLLVFALGKIKHLDFPLVKLFGGYLLLLVVFSLLVLALFKKFCKK